MSEVHQGTFIITREDQPEDPKTIFRDGLRIGRLPDSDVWLNHPTVSRLHAGINEIDGYFYLVNLSASSATTLNGRTIPFNEAEALTVGDVLQIGPFFLEIENINEATETLSVRVLHQFAFHIGERQATNVVEIDTGPLDTPRPAALSTEAVDSLNLFWNKRTREKAGRPSPLHPRTPPHLGKARFNWTPTRDLVRPWPFAIFIWALITVGALSTLAAFKYAVAFAPEEISATHSRMSFSRTPEIAKQPNGGSCTSCHAVGVSANNTEKMNANCTACHQTTAFSATITRAHLDAGITCTTCHAEHRGEGYGPMKAGLDSCTKCHSDGNKKLYNGKSVHTPHGGTYGYPVSNGVWVWKGLDDEELSRMPELVAVLKKNKASPDQPQQWRNAQFHAIHMYRVRISTTRIGLEDVQAVNQELSCSSCHKSGYMGANVDRAYPRTTCALCHNEQVFHKAMRSLTGSDKPSCTSCHVQHSRDTLWTPTLRKVQDGMPLNQDQ
jgi:pSer/pThr/pTyr-binding forkhead associated (FHA) protein